MRSQPASRLRAPMSLLCALALGAAAGPACIDLSGDGVQTPRPVQNQARTLSIPLNRSNKYDVLFVVDNTTEIFQTEFQNGFDRFLKPFQDLAAQGAFADLHIGVVTTDYGAGATGAPGCTPSGLAGGGDQGKLQVIGRHAPANCQKPNGSNFIAYQFGSSPVHNLPGGQDLVQTFTCMTSLGDSGCGFEHPLESAFAALHNDIVENQRFLRNDAVLAVVFATNEDDGSAPPDTDVFDKNQVAKYGYEDDYSRKTRFGVMCGYPATFPPYADSHGALSGCFPAPNADAISGPGKLYDVQRYKDFFGLPRVQGGAKDSPLDVVLIGIVGPTAPFQVILANLGTDGQPYVPCGMLNEHSNPPCVPQLQHSCMNPRNQNHFADPAVRLADVIGSAKTNRLFSPCADDYGDYLTEAAKATLKDTTAGCIVDPFPKDANGDLVTTCNVGVATLNPDGTETRTGVVQCDATGSVHPCWRVARDPLCATASPDGVLLSVDFGSTAGVPNQPPPHSSAMAECVTRASRK